MAYAVKADIVTRLGNEHLQLTADSNSDHKTDNLRIDAELDDGAGIIDMYISRRYELPLALPFPAVLKALNVDITVYRICRTWDHLTDEKRRRYEDAIELLKDIASGAADLGLEDPPLGEGGGPEIFSEDRIFTRDLMKGVI